MQGRAGPYQMGLLGAVTDGAEVTRDAVLRLRRDVLRRGFVGVMGTLSDRESRPGSVAGGVDFNLPWLVGNGSNLVLLGNAAWSRDSVDGATGAHYLLALDYPNDHADIVTRYERIDAAYDPALGFVVQNGIHRLAGSTRITPRPRNASIVRRWEFNLANYNVVWGLDGQLDNARISLMPLGIRFQSGDVIEFNYHRMFDGPATPFEIVDGTTIAPGNYWWDRVEFVYEGANLRPVVFETEWSAGTFYTGRRLDGEVQLRWRLQPHYEFSLEYERNDVDLPEAAFVVNTARLRADYAINPRLTITGFAQYDDESDRGALNARLRWTPSPGSDLFVVWNSVWPFEPVRAFAFTRPQSGALVVKYT